MCADDVIVDTLVVSELDLESSTEWGEHLGEDELFVPDRFVAAVPNRGLALQIFCLLMILYKIADGLKSPMNE